MTTSACNIRATSSAATRAATSSAASGTVIARRLFQVSEGVSVIGRHRSGWPCSLSAAAINSRPGRPCQIDGASGTSWKAINSVNADRKMSGVRMRSQSPRFIPIIAQQPNKTAPPRRSGNDATSLRDAPPVKRTKARKSSGIQRDHSPSPCAPKRVAIFVLLFMISLFWHCWGRKRRLNAPFAGN
ncbi:hypothetical protein [Sphingopyxis sp. JAI128]|uniref:hypothetical protein n=1 Tax=Sphingopyxis sp. JAI128 TaxID=2723066 RepID=UPI00162029CF|nr:hypothetical protein [Sphingopyxis sp. JAI128]MBB6424392.1 hypothetical protein [Sphingopyxis sp. JAI128]